MAEVWDVIIVGSGVGGLIAAAHLVKAGLRVLALEKNPHPGGTAYVYHRKGFTFPMGPLGFSHPEFIQETFKTLKIGENLKLLRAHYRIKAFDMDIPLSLPFHEMLKELGSIFPSEAQGIRDFFEYVEEMVSPGSLPIKKASDISASGYLHHLIKDRRLRRILGSMGTREPYSGLPLLAAMWNLMCKEGIWYPTEGMKSFCNRLVNAVINPQERRQGKGVGEIRLRAEVMKIRVEKRKALGVTFKDGTEIKSGSVISNADYKNTFIKLIDSDAIPSEWYHAVSNARQTNSVFQVCLGLDKGRADLSAFKDARRLIYRRNKEAVDERDLNWNEIEIAPQILAGQELEVSLWGSDDEILSPEGGAVIVVRTEAEYSHFARYRSITSRRSSQYQEYKTRLARALIDEIKNLVPGIEKAILVMDAATPLTFEDQGGRSEGAIAGWSWDYEDFKDEKLKELIRTPIQGLYMAGYQAFSALFMGGIPTAMESGKRAAEAVLKETGPIQEIIIPGVK